LIVYFVLPQNLVCELLIAQTGSTERTVCLPQDYDDVGLSVMSSSIDRLVSGLKEVKKSNLSLSNIIEWNKIVSPFHLQGNLK
jgi:hypothetical protein